MVRLSIYNEKGGVGKTTMSYLLASYLAYVKGKNVCVLDFDYPSYHFANLRYEEELILQNPKSQLSLWMAKNPVPFEPYEIIRIPTNGAGVYRPADVFSFMKVISGYDYVIFDFPGRFTEEEPVAFLAANGRLDFVAIPMDTDSQCRKSALVVADALKRQGVPCAVYWNRVSNVEVHSNGNRFIRGAEPFNKLGVPIMDESVRELRKLSRDSAEMMFVRSTLCFPMKFINFWSPSLVPFLEALISRIDKSRKE